MDSDYDAILLANAIVEDTGTAACGHRVLCDDVCDTCEQCMDCCFCDMEFRMGSDATENGEVVYSASTSCNADTINYLLGFPKYEHVWYEIRGGVFGDEWIRVDKITTNQSA